MQGATTHRFYSADDARGIGFLVARIDADCNQHEIRAYFWNAESNETRAQRFYSHSSKILGDPSYEALFAVARIWLNNRAWEVRRDGPELFNSALEPFATNPTDPDVSERLRRRVFQICSRAPDFAENLTEREGAEHGVDFCDALDAYWQICSEPINDLPAAQTSDGTAGETSLRAIDKLAQLSVLLSVPRSSRGGRSHLEGSPRSDSPASHAVSTAKS